MLLTETESNKNRIFQGINGNPRKFTRDIPKTQINLGSYPIRVYNVHFKATPYFPEPHSEEEEAKIKKAMYKRLAEADEVVRMLAEDMKKMPSKLHIVAGDTNSHDGNPAVEHLTEKSNPAPLIDPLKDSKGDDAVSRPQSKARMDYILLSPGLAERVKPASAHVYHSEEALKGSDHLPVYLTIELE